MIKHVHNIGLLIKSIKLQNQVHKANAWPIYKKFATQTTLFYAKKQRLEEGKIIQTFSTVTRHVGNCFAGSQFRKSTDPNGSLLTAGSVNTQKTI